MSELSAQRRLALLAGPVAAAVGGGAMLWTGWSSDAAWTVAVTSLTVVWWIFEPIPIPATSLIPIGAMPLTGVLSQADVSQAYGNSLVLLLLGGFILSTAMERSGAHRRIALAMVRLFGGTSSRRLVFGFMSAAAMLSMWISNTATTLMLLPVALAVLEKAEDPKLATPLLLGIAYAASLGGIGTPIGTPPNLVFMQVYSVNTDTEVSFLSWMGWGVPVVICFFPLMGLWLTRHLDYRGTLTLPEVGRWRPEEARVLMVFAATAALWVTRREPFGGWSAWLDMPAATDGAVALLAVVVMFVVPNGKGGRLLDWETATRIPWGMLLLFAGGITIARAFVASGLSAALGTALSELATWPTFALIGIICLTVTFLTEMTSNTATTTLLMPILAAAAIGAGLPPSLLMVPAAMSASCAFMLPVATAPNTIVFGTGQFTTQTMAREGFILNLIGAGVITLVCLILIS
jgi:sodium-dependent dicarboxylate transporter 2/3/5